MDERDIPMPGDIRTVRDARLWFVDAAKLCMENAAERLPDPDRRDLVGYYLRGRADAFVLVVQLLEGVEGVEGVEDADRL